HVYAAYALPSSGTSEVRVKDYLSRLQIGPLVVNGYPIGATTVSSAVATQRFMPWICATGGVAFVSWYDRSASVGAPRNDLTDYVLGSALGRGSGLQAGPIVNLSVNPDPECASGFPCGTGDAPNAPACGVAPVAGGGCPKYGDYNGNACAAGFVYTAWASATAPPGVAPVGQISVFFATTQALAILPGPDTTLPPEQFPSLKWLTW